MDEQFDLIMVGTGFASSLFLEEALRRLGPAARILVLERGARVTNAEYTSHPDRYWRASVGEIDNTHVDKRWNYLLMFGGSSNCWWGNTPRMIPADFELRSRFGIGSDWPLRYDDIEEYYCRAEAFLGVAGDNALAEFMPRSRPFPQPMHKLSDPDRMFRAAYPDRFFGLPSARARVATETRSRCCASGICHVCPIDAKTTILNSARPIYEDHRITLRIGASVETVEFTGDTATAVHYVSNGVPARVRGDLIALGANGIFNAHILLRSGVRQPALGRGLTEQVSIFAVVYLDGVDNFQGSTARCGHGYMLHGPERRHERAAALMLTHNTFDVSHLRPLRGRTRQILGLTFVYEDLREDANHVRLNPAAPGRPEIVFRDRSEYARAGLQALESELPRVLAPLPVDGYHIFPEPNRSESHIIGTTVMGADPATSVIDRDLVHHRYRNLLLLGSGAFPTAAPANPTLTLSALSIRAADRLFSSR